MKRFDIAIIGAGIAGAGLAAQLARDARVVVLEAEAQPGYHSTGRSAAFWQETYGGPGVQPFTSASEPWLEARGMLRRRAGLHIADAAGGLALARLAAEFKGQVVLKQLDRAAVAAAIPGLRPGWDQGLLEPSTADIDVAALHGHFLREARSGGAELYCDARILTAERSGGGWRLGTAAGVLQVDIVVDAAGAWADQVAVICGVAPLGIQPYRRTMLQLAVEPAAPEDIPLVIDADGRFYFKPEAGGRVWLSPHDETAVEPGDAAAEELDVALAIAQLERVVDWRVLRVERAWAGLRSFAPDRLPVYGFDPAVEGFFWCAGQGGFGIQTAPAASRLAADLLLGGPPSGLAEGIDPARFAPGRLR